MDTNQTNAHAAILRAGDCFTFGPAHKTRECAERGVSPFEGAEILGFAELFPAPIMGMHFALQRHANETIAELRELERRGVRIQANRGTVDEPRWETLTEPAQFTCAAHLYRAHPDDLAASIPDEDPDEDSLVDGEGFEAIGVLQAIAQKLSVPCTHAAIEDAIDDLLRDRKSPAVRLVAEERRRQIEAEGWSTDHDDQHANGALADAAGCYALSAGGVPEELFESLWPWSREWWKPSPGDPIRSLVKAGALIVAEIERQQRAAAARPITIWQINDMEWFVGAGTPESILAWYMKEHGVSHEDATGHGDELPRALDDDELDTLKFVDFDEDESPTGAVRTFREQLAVEISQGGTFPRPFASTEV